MEINAEWIIAIAAILSLIPVITSMYSHVANVRRDRLQTLAKFYRSPNEALSEVGIMFNHSKPILRALRRFHQLNNNDNMRNLLELLYKDLRLDYDTFPVPATFIGRDDIK